uniref:PEX-1N domain-containing protein n=1 Tax=Steinernema glaseri TaxID=37863 RepID=A0A1I7XYJ4_9BILA
MDAVPQLFVQSVILCALDLNSVKEGRKIPSLWGNVFSATSKKIHTLSVIVCEKQKLYAAAKAICSSTLVSLDRVDSKLIINFQIDATVVWDSRSISREYTEISLDGLQRLIRLICPTTEGRQPVRYNKQSSNSLWLGHHIHSINGQLLSRQLPVDEVSLFTYIPEVDVFFENAGPLYHVYCSMYLKPSTVDAMIEKFVPVDGGSFTLSEQTRLSREQLERLVLKCEMSKRKVTVTVFPQGVTESSEITDFFDFNKYYSTKVVQLYEVVAIREGTELTMWVQWLTRARGELQWRWGVIPWKRLH